MPELRGTGAPATVARLSLVAKLTPSGGWPCRDTWQAYAERSGGGRVPRQAGVLARIGRNLGAPAPFEPTLAHPRFAPTLTEYYLQRLAPSRPPRSFQRCGVRLRAPS